MASVAGAEGSSQALRVCTWQATDAAKLRLQIELKASKKAPRQPQLVHKIHQNDGRNGPPFYLTLFLCCAVQCNSVTFGAFSKLSTGPALLTPHTPHTPQVSPRSGVKSESEFSVVSVTPSFDLPLLLAKHHVVQFTRSQWMASVDPGEPVFLLLDVDPNAMVDATAGEFRGLSSTTAFGAEPMDRRVQFAGGQMSHLFPSLFAIKVWKW
ncbi:hypothetical protein GE09DRAFT_353438 [Coniochaeta sp. 2T2.1]|nr:hypothetical protein GE09DRAFT_353438 [Coniochaeta sp. 2T2.1]